MTQWPEKIFVWIGATAQGSLRRAACFLLAVAFVLPFAMLASERSPETAAVATSHPIATRIGIEILQQGGNAFDAAVAVAAVLSVVEPHRSGLGGGGFWLLHRAEDGFQTVIDARETAPLAATGEMYRDNDGNVRRGSSTSGPLAAGIPGEAAGMAFIAEKYGRLTLSENLAPAIRQAREGFAVYSHYLDGLGRKLELMRGYPAAAESFLDQGDIPQAGFIIRQPDLARTLIALAERGHTGFYRGEVASKLVAGVKKDGGIWTLEDLARYTIKEREPVIGTSRGTRIVSTPPPSAGGVMLINSLNILSGYDLTAVSEIERKHLLAETLRRSFRDRAVYLGDPDFVEMPLELLMHPYYAAGQRTTIRLDQATPSATLTGRLPETQKGIQTTHYSIMDAEGNRAAASLSLNFWFGSGYVVPDTGVLLNNQMNDFAIQPGVPSGFGLLGFTANEIEPGKRMLSSMAPTFLESDRGVAILGTPGGSRIVSMILLATLAWHEGATATEMVTLPRFHHQYMRDEIFFEPGALSNAEIAALEQKGHALRESSRPYGNMQVITWDFATGEVEAASDPRGTGEVLVY